MLCLSISQEPATNLRGSNSLGMNDLQISNPNPGRVV